MRIVEKIKKKYLINTKTNKQTNNVHVFISKCFDWLKSSYLKIQRIHILIYYPFSFYYCLKLRFRYKSVLACPSWISKNVARIFFFKVPLKKNMSPLIIICIKKYIWKTMVLMIFWSSTNKPLFLLNSATTRNRQCSAVYKLGSANYKEPIRVH